MDKEAQINFWYLIAAVLSILFLQNLYTQYTRVEPIPYSRFQSLLDQGKVAEITITENHIYGKLKVVNSEGFTDFVTTRVEPEFAEELDKHDVIYTGIVQSTWMRDLLSWLLPMALFIGIWLFIIRRMSGGMSSGLMSIGKSRAKVFVEKETKVTFADVAGVDEAKEELIEIINFLKNPVDYGRFGWASAKGRFCWLVRLVLERHCWRVLWQARLRYRFFSISGSEFVELFVGVGAARVRDLF